MLRRESPHATTLQWSRTYEYTEAGVSDTTPSGAAARGGSPLRSPRASRRTGGRNDGTGLRRQEVSVFDFTREDHGYPEIVADGHTHTRIGTVRRQAPRRIVDERTS